MIVSVRVGLFVPIRTAWKWPIRPTCRVRRELPNPHSLTHSFCNHVSSLHRFSIKNRKFWYRLSIVWRTWLSV